MDVATLGLLDLLVRAGGCLYRFAGFARPLVLTALLNACYGLVPGIALAQPAPTFHVQCSELRKAVSEHQLDSSVLTTISVEGEISEIGTDGAIVYILLCEPPDPLVLCATYSDNGNIIGDRVAIGGSYSPKGPDHIMLDPCLHVPMDRFDD